MLCEYELTHYLGSVSIENVGRKQKSSCLVFKIIPALEVVTMANFIDFNFLLQTALSLHLCLLTYLPKMKNTFAVAVGHYTQSCLHINKHLLQNVNIV